MAQHLPEALVAQFTPDDLPGQYVLARDPRLVPAHWPAQQRHGWTLACHPRLPCHSLLDPQGTTVGFLLGHPICPEHGLLLRDGITLTIDELEEPEQWLYRMGGSWVAILLSLPVQRIYLDPAGTQNAVYCESTRQVASSAALIPYTAQTADRQALLAAMPIPNANAMFPLQMTARNGICRLLPNHYLELSTWQQQRHWPQGAPEEIDDVGAAAAETATLLHEAMAAVAEHMPLQLSLTAGRDSRTLLACARPILTRTRFFTSVLPGDAPGRDVYFARRIARDHGLVHDVIPFEAADQRERDLWLFRSGGCVGNYLSYLGMRVASRRDPTAAYLPGYISALARDIWTAKIRHLEPDWDGQTVTAAMLLGLMNAPLTPETAATVEAWLTALPLETTRDQLNLFFLEQRLGGWSSVLTLPFTDTHALELWPFNQRRLIEIMFGLHGRAKEEAQLNKAIIAQQWPSLLAYPFNESDRRYHYQRKLVRTWNRLRRG